MMCSVALAYDGYSRSYLDQTRCMDRNDRKCDDLSGKVFPEILLNTNSRG